LGPPVGIPYSIRAPLESIKVRVRPLEYKFGEAFSRTLLDSQKAQARTHKQYSTQVDVGSYAPAARTTLNSHVISAFIHPKIKLS
jgi:hypothetical protein